MRALVTGGAGFVGHHIVNELVKQKIKTVVFDLAEPSDFFDQNPTLKNSPLIDYIQGDVLDYDQVDGAVKKCNTIFHTAAIADIEESRHQPVRTMQINVMGTVNCLEAAKKHAISRFLYASSAYTAGKKGSFYRVSKQASEALCKTYYEEHGLEYTILRYGSLYGRESNQWNFIYGLCKAVLTTGEFTYMSSPESEREYIHINDAAHETVRIASEKEFANKAVLITGHQRIKIKELFAMLEEIVGKKIQIHYNPQLVQSHYVMTPYSFEADVATRINLSEYIDISEGILDCLRAVQNEIDQQESGKPGDI
ncbi:NAD-dependent epimerase/dehydratase family protein [Methanoregula sp.]|uniref:NAD-dependent epimerase/dehydratase family protein n=1 Tax=Methanoregula sp. TaxID=2052170 RepID=UPI003568EDB0